MNSVSKIRYGFYSHVGARSKMEDRCAVHPNFIPYKVGFFAIFDGHGGDHVSEFCSDQFPLALKKELTVTGECESPNHWETYLGKTFAKVDAKVEAELPADVGSTAVVAVITSSFIIVANCGDSRAVLCRGTEPVLLSEDHKPNRPEELQRIEEAGGTVIEWEGCSRIYGILAVSRSIGDALMKPYIISEPEFRVSPRTDEDEFLILASDGLWDVFSTNEVVNMVRKFLQYWYKKKAVSDLAIETQTDPAAQATAEYLTKQALKKGSRDNLSVIIVDMKASRHRS